jgi:hypothetical protein
MALFLDLNNQLSDEVRSPPPTALNIQEHGRSQCPPLGAMGRISHKTFSQGLWGSWESHA